MARKLVLPEFGRFAAPDRRDRKFLLAPRRATRRRRIWRTTWVGDQLQTPQCVGYAWAGLLRCAPINQFLLPAGIYQMAQQCDEWEGDAYEGTSVRGGAKVLHALGVIAEYRWAFDAATVARHVLTVGPVVFGTNWYEGMMTPNARGRVTLDGGPLGGHAYLINGANLDTGELDGVNSWGREWGVRGRFKLSFDQVDQLLDEDGEACTAVETKPVAGAA